MSYSINLITAGISRLNQIAKTHNMKSCLSTLLLALLLNVLVDSVHAQCPESATRGIQIVEDFLTEDRYAERREQHEISAPVNSIRVLNEEQDLEACTHFSNVFASGDETGYRTFHFYKAGDFYFVLLLNRPRDEWPDPESLFGGPREVGGVHDQNFDGLLLFSI